MVIGRFCKHRPIKGKSDLKHGIDYHAKKKAWMIQNLFLSSLKQLDVYICCEPGRKIILLLDNYSECGNHSNIPELIHISVLYLPQNATSCFQPLVAGIFATLKATYTRRLLFVYSIKLTLRKGIYTMLTY